jgi:hypothetical protein
MPPQHTVKLRPKINLCCASSQENQVSVTRTMIGPLGIAHEQAQMAKRRNTQLKSMCAVSYSLCTLTPVSELMQQERRLLQDLAPVIYNKGWEIQGGREDDGSIVDLGEGDWEELDPSHAGGKYKVFHDLCEEMYQVTGR